MWISWTVYYLRTFLCKTSLSENTMSKNNRWNGMCIWGLLRTCLDMTSGLSGVSLLTSRVFRSWTFSSGWVVVLYSSVMSLHLMIFHSVGRSLLTAGYFRSFLWEKVQYIYFFWIGNVTENKSKTNLKDGFFVEPWNLASPDGFRKKFPSSAPNFPS